MARTEFPFLRYPVRSFRGGLNRAVSSFDLRDDELTEVSNVQFGFKGSIIPRFGARRYDLTTGAHLAVGRQFPIRGMHRYNKSDGSREIIIQGDRFIYNDSNDQEFADLVELNQGDDGFVRFTQWRDSVYIHSKNEFMATFHSTATPVGRTAGVLGEISPPGNYWSTAAQTGVLDTSSTYQFRFTFERFLGTDFIGESLPLFRRGGSGLKESPGIIYEVESFTPTFGGVTLSKNANIPEISDDSTIRFINVYRSTQGNNPSERDPDTNFFYIGRIARDDYLNASTAVPIFSDDGSFLAGFGARIVYNKLERPPRCKFGAVHKNRFWGANIGATEYIQEEFNIDQNSYRVYFSEYLDPESYLVTSFLDVGVHDGEAITGLLSWKNRALYVFKPNSIWGIFGGDIEQVEGVPDIELVRINDTVGCVAPESLSAGEDGIVFLSNRGVEFFDGSTVTQLRSKKIEPILDNIPGPRREKAAGLYTTERKYLLAITDQTVNLTGNTVSLEYDFFTDTWTQHSYGENVGFNKFIELKKGDEGPVILASVELSGLAALAAGLVQVLGDVNYDILTGTGITWSAETKFFDCGEPEVTKVFHGIIARLATAQAMTVASDVDEGTVTDSRSIAIPTTHTWDEANLNWQGSPIEDTTHVWGALRQADTFVPLPEELIGRRINFRFSGTSTLPGTELQGFTILYTREKRVRD